MIYAKIHLYQDHNGIDKKTLISTPESYTDNSFETFDVPDETWLVIDNSSIRIMTKAEHDTHVDNTMKINNLHDIQFKRASEYPPMTDYLDAVVKGDSIAIQSYIDKCKAIKAKYPKV